MEERLTKKVEGEDRYIATNFKRNGNLFHSIDNYNAKVYNKLGKLEDLEEELGCPLDVREQALKQDEIFYIEKNQNKMIRVVAMNCGYINNGECVLNCLANGIWFCLPTKDYKNTWWLKETKEE